MQGYRIPKALSRLSRPPPPSFLDRLTFAIGPLIPAATLRRNPRTSRAGTQGRNNGVNRTEAMCQVEDLDAEGRIHWTGFPWAGVEYVWSCNEVHI